CLLGGVGGGRRENGTEVGGTVAHHYGVLAKGHLVRQPGPRVGGGLGQLRPALPLVGQGFDGGETGSQRVTLGDKAVTSTEQTNGVVPDVPALGGDLGEVLRDRVTLGGDLVVATGCV